MAQTDVEVGQMRGTSVRRLAAAVGPLTTSRQKILINVVALLGLCVVFAALSPNFLSETNLTNVLRNITPVVIVGSAFTMLMVAKGLDLSVGSVIALSGCVAALATAYVPLPVAFVVGIGVGMGVGSINAILCVKFGINSVIATIGMLYMVRGAAMLITSGIAVYAVPEGFSTLGAGSAFRVPNPVWLMAIVVAVFIALERYTLLGRYSIAVGSNEEASFLSGIPGNRTKVLLYLFVGAMAGIAGILQASRLKAGLPYIGQGFEFEVIVATVLGGTSLAGGEGKVAGTVLGALIVGVLANGLNLLGVPSFWQTVAMGFVLVLAVALDVGLRNRLASRATKADSRRRADAAASL